MLIVRVFLLLGYEEGKDLEPLEEDKYSRL
jgi:hypothetical protein